MTESRLLPEPNRIAGLKVKGDSMWPRYLDGEIVLYDPTPELPEALINKYAVVDCLDGRRLLKILRKGSKVLHWNLESHNAGTIENIAILCAYRVLGALAD